VIVYLASPNTQQQAEHLEGMPALLSFACYPRPRRGIGESWLDQYMPTFSRRLIDSGAFSELTQGTTIDLGAYADWAAQWSEYADAVAGLDDISGDWRRSLANYEAFPLGFPTFHETDPPEFLDDLIPLARERGSWIGLGLLPATRQAKANSRWVREACERVPDGLHVHGWAMRAYAHIGRLDSVDSTNWWRDAMKLRTLSDLAHLTYGECLDIVVKRYARFERPMRRDREDERPLFRGIA
jgi:hypothetical protein